MPEVTPERGLGEKKLISSGSARKAAAGYRLEMNIDEQIARAPKVLLHDHLDGGLRPQTVLDLARGCGHIPPAETVEGVAAWFYQAAHSGSLETYLETFAHTVAVTQTESALFRVAAEAAEDLAADGVIYAEVRFAPELHTSTGLSLDQIIEAVLAGFREGERTAAAAGHDIRIGTLLTAMRTAARSRDIAERVVAFRDRGVVGFDIAGREAGFPPTRHLDAFEYLQRENSHFTIHAGEAFGLPSIWEAIQWCGADRLGHGVRIIDDITVGADGKATLGGLASYVRDRRIPLELCPTSNVMTGAAASDRQALRDGDSRRIQTFLMNPLLEVKELLGHAHLDTTLGYLREVARRDPLADLDHTSWSDAFLSALGEEQK